MPQYPPPIVDPLNPGTSGSVLASDGVQFKPSTAVPSSSITPPGSTTQVFFNNAGAWGASADLTFNDSTDSLSVNGGATTATGHVHMTVDAAGKGVVTQNQNTTLTGYAFIHYGSGGEQYFLINAAGTPRSYYTTCQLIGFEHPNYTGCIDFFTSSSQINFRVGTPSGGSGTAPVRAMLSSVGVLTLYYDGSNYVTFTPSSAGILTVAPSGGTTEFTGKVTSDGYGVTRNLYLNTADSSTVSNTVAETDFDVTFTLPAGFLSGVGRAIRVEAMMDNGATGTPTATYKLKFGSTVLSTTGAMRMTNNTGASCVFLVTCRTAGASGAVKTTQEIAASGTATGLGPSVTTGSLDLTAAQTVTVSVTMSVANALNTSTLVQLRVLAVNC